MKVKGTKKEKKPRTLPGLTDNAVNMRMEVISYLTQHIHPLAGAVLAKLPVNVVKYFTPEDWLHIGIGQMMQFRFKRLQAFHPKNEGKSGIIEQVKKRYMGVLAGASDYIIEHPDILTTLYMEVKVKPNKPTPEQTAFLNFQRGRGHLAEVVYSMEQAHRILKDYYTKDEAHAKESIAA